MQPAQGTLGTSVIPLIPKEADTASVAQSFQSSDMQAFSRTRLSGAELPACCKVAARKDPAPEPQSIV